MSIRISKLSHFVLFLFYSVTTCLQTNTFYHVILWTRFAAHFLKTTNETMHCGRLSSLCRRWPYRGVWREQSWFSNVSKASTLSLSDGSIWNCPSTQCTVVEEQFVLHIVVPIFLCLGVFFMLSLIATQIWTTWLDELKCFKQKFDGGDVTNAHSFLKHTLGAWGHIFISSKLKSFFFELKSFFQEKKTYQCVRWQRYKFATIQRWWSKL